MFSKYTFKWNNTNILPNGAKLKYPSRIEILIFLLKYSGKIDYFSYRLFKLNLNQESLSILNNT